MIKDPFVNAPTVGNDDSYVSMEEIQKRLRNLELREPGYEYLLHPVELEARSSCWGKIWKFLPSLFLSIAAVMNASCKCKKAFFTKETKHHRHK